jgi:outer membrane protein OmpA-like peptidoglycan-associated protein
MAPSPRRALLAACLAASLAACVAASPAPEHPDPSAAAEPADTAEPTQPGWRPSVPERCRGGGGPSCRRRRVVVTSTDLELLEPIAFVDNTAELTPGAYHTIEAVARSLLDNPSILVLEVRGHSDSLLHPADRAELSRKRAEVVAAYIIAQGVDPARVTTYGASDSELRYPADDPRNRRVEFLIVARDE